MKLAYDALVNGIGEKAADAITAIEESYAKNITDEFIKPTVIIDKNHQPVAVIENEDAVICFNFRTDRCREITEVLTQKDIPEQGMKKLSLHYTTMTQYDHSFKNVKVIFENDDLKNTFGEIISQVSAQAHTDCTKIQKNTHTFLSFSAVAGKNHLMEKDHDTVT